MSIRVIESNFHDLRTEVKVPDGIRPGMLVSWLRDNDPESLEKVCPFAGCDCEVDEWDEGLRLDDDE